MEVKTKLRKLRLSRGIPAWWLAGIAKSSLTTLTAIERLERPAMPALRTMLAKVLGVPVDTLFKNNGFAKEVGID